MKLYDLIYADPPWQYSDKSKHRGGAERHYNTMGIHEIKELPVVKIASPDSVLFLWVTFPLLKEGIATLEAWGFKYKTLGFCWVKKAGNGNLSIGMGHHTRSNAEICLLGVRGRGLKRVNAGIRSTQIHIRGRHSAKPNTFREDLEKLYGPQERLELFAREEAPGWTSWGNEIEGFEGFFQG